MGYENIYKSKFYNFKILDHRFQYALQYKTMKIVYVMQWKTRDRSFTLALKGTMTTTAPSITIGLYVRFPMLRFGIKTFSFVKKYPSQRFLENAQDCNR